MTRRRAIVAIMATLVGLAAVGPVGGLACAEGKRLALLVGVDRYPEGSGFGSLRYTERDVQDLEKVLVGAGYRPEDVRTLTRTKGNEQTRFMPSKRRLLGELKAIAENRSPQDSILVALSGHGITRKAKDRPKSIGYFAPIDGEVQDVDSLVSLDDLYATLEASRAGTKVLLVDACRDDPTEGRVGAISFTAAPPPPSVAALFACRDGEIAWDAADLGGGHGVFFHYVIEGLNGAADGGDRDGRITMAELAAYAQDKVPDYVSIHKGRSQMPLSLGNGGRIMLVDNSSRAARLPELVTSSFTGMKLKLIPAGEFLMGSSKAEDPDALDGEQPRHRVKISRPFYLGVTEVTQAQYRAVTGKNPSGFSATGYQKGKVAGERTDDLPVEMVSWDDAVSYCNALSEKEGLRPFYRIAEKVVSVPDRKGDGYRLPTEAEWEYACRAGSTSRFHFGDAAEELGEHAWFDENSGNRTHRVGTKKANGFGLYDMHGNVGEWCWDEYGEKYYGESPAVDPTGPSGAGHRMYRGGSWSFNPRGAWSAFRYRFPPGGRVSDLGLRLARGRSGQGS